jgi:hypothetical protein
MSTKGDIIIGAQQQFFESKQHREGCIGKVEVWSSERADELMLHPGIE